MKKPKVEMDSTDNRKIYNRARKAYLATKGKISCVFCPYHAKDNAEHKFQKSWKKFRKTKYKIADMV